MTKCMHGGIILGRRELIAKLAAVANRIAAHNQRAGEEGVNVTVNRVASFVTECGKEFELTNEEQMLFLKFIVCGDTNAEELLKGEC